MIYFSYRKETSISVLKGQCARLAYVVGPPPAAPLGGQGQSAPAEVLRNPGDTAVAVQLSLKDRFPDLLLLPGSESVRT